MSAVQLNTDVALGVALPSRNARHRIARLGPVVDSILASHDYPPVIEKLLAEALTLTAAQGAAGADHHPGPGRRRESSTSWSAAMLAAYPVEASAPLNRSAQ
jgi:hypothetical protein